jgi:hypothetical protein
VLASRTVDELPNNVALRKATHRLAKQASLENAIVKPPVEVDWERYLPQIAQLGLELTDSPI